MSSVNTTHRSREHKVIIEQPGAVHGLWTVESRAETRARNGAVKWVCRCECGTVAEVLGQHLRSGKSSRCKSCGSSGYKRRDGRGAFRHAYNRYKTRSNGDFPFTLDEFIVLVTGLCAYCGSEPSAVRRTYGRRRRAAEPETAKMHTLDRIDSAVGYARNNVATCCHLCNRMKSDLDLTVFTEHVQKIATHLTGGPTP